MEIADTIKIHHATRAKAERLMAMFVAEYPALELRYDTNEDESQISVWYAVHIDAEGEENTVTEGPKVPEIADVLEACEAMGLDPEIGLQEGPSGSVVPEEYRVRYKEASSSGQSCGDWLAEFLTNQTTADGGFDQERFQSILDQNAVDQSGKWASLRDSGQRGATGRWRMNGRQQLEKVVAYVGSVVGVDGTTYNVPKSDLAELRRRHARYIEKRQKAEAKAD